MVKEFFKRAFALLGVEVRKTSARRYNKLASLSIPYEEWEERENKIYLKRLNVTVDSIDSPLIQGYQMAKALAVRGDAVFYYDAESRLRVTIQGVNFFIEYTDELYVIKEVFVSGDYNYQSPHDFMVIDIGMNIGATSLFFQKIDRVKKIYAYELFEPTYQSALRNLEINKSSKIISHNFGLGGANQKLTLPYSKSSKARMGVKGLPPKELFSDAELINVTIKDAAEEIGRIASLEPTLKKVCKMDCEGAETEILEQLFEQHVATLVDIFIIEWHSASIQIIERNFIHHGFDILKQNSEVEQTGLIYAFKK